MTAHLFRLLAFSASISVLSGPQFQSLSAESGDHSYLTPIDEDRETREPEASYRKAVEQNLFLTPGEIARVVRLPGTVGVETVVAVYRQQPPKQAEYAVTVTQPSKSLWDPENKKGDTALGSTTILRLDAGLPKTTALAIQKVWKAMLLDVREPPESNELLLESSTQIFSAAGPDGKLLRRELEGLGAGKTAALSKLVDLLIEYCDTPKTRRLEIAHRIEKAASTLLTQIASSDGNKKPNPKSASSAELWQIISTSGLESLAQTNPERKEPVLQRKARSRDDYFLLYSWKIAGGEYDFALVPIGRGKAFIADFKPARSGLGGPSGLKAILATLPSRSLIVWEEASDAGLELPPAQNVDDVVSFARTKDIRVELNPALNETSDISTTAPLQTLATMSNAARQTPDDLPLGNPSSQYSAVNNQLSPTELKIVGAWSWTYIEGVGRIIFTVDHKVRAGFPPDDKDGRRIGDDEFDIVQAGTWRLEGEILITEMDNSPLINILEHLDPSNRPALEKKVERRKIVKIDGNKIVFDNGSSYDRVKR